MRSRSPGRDAVRSPIRLLQATAFVSTLDRFAMPPMLVVIAHDLGVPLADVRAGSRRLLPRLRAQPAAVGSGLRPAGPGADDAAHPAGGRVGHAGVRAERLGRCARPDPRPGRRLLRRGLPRHPDLPRRHRARVARASRDRAADGRRRDRHRRRLGRRRACSPTWPRGGWLSWSPAAASLVLAVAAARLPEPDPRTVPGPTSRGAAADDRAVAASRCWCCCSRSSRAPCCSAP